MASHRLEAVLGSLNFLRGLTGMAILLLMVSESID